MPKIYDPSAQAVQGFLKLEQAEDDVLLVAVDKIGIPLGEYDRIKFHAYKLISEQTGLKIVLRQLYEVIE